MSQLNTALTQTTDLLILARDVLLCFNLESELEDELGVKARAYRVSFDNYAPGDFPTFRVTVEDDTAFGRVLDDESIALSIPVEVIGLPHLQAFLDRYRETELWVVSGQYVLGTLNVLLDHDDHGAVFLEHMQSSFEIDKVSAHQLRSSEDQIVRDLDLLAR